MLNYIWMGLILFAVLAAGWAEIRDSGWIQRPPAAIEETEGADEIKEVAEEASPMRKLTDEAFNAARTAVMSLALPLVGIMTLWLGIMRLAERSGIVYLLARGIRPLLRRLFPDVPANHPAHGAILMNVSANMLGLGNAATPFGIKAMQHLQTLNLKPHAASNAMCTFLAINTSSVTLIPATAVGILAAAGARDPTAIIGTAIFATACSTVAAIVAVKTLERLPFFSLDRIPAEKAEDAGKQTTEPETVELTPPPRFEFWQWLCLGLFLAFFLALFLTMVFPKEGAEGGVGVRILESISILAIPFLLSFFPLFGILARLKVYEEFIEGAKEGFYVAVRIIPYLVAILVAIAMFRAAGGIELLAWAFGPALSLIGFPPDLLPMAVMRPLSGSGALGVFSDLATDQATGGPDGLLARMAGTMMGSTETTFYVLAVYFGAVGVRATRHALPAGLIADAVGIMAAVFICRWMFA